MPSEVEICNMALSNLGVGSSRWIDDLTEASEEAQTCNLWFDSVRDEVLSEHPWPFAQAYKVLNKLEDDPNDEWDFSYNYPSDAITLVRIVAGNGFRQSTPVPFQIAHGSTGAIILTNEDEAVAAYTKRIEDTTRYPKQFYQLVAWRLAKSLAMPITENRGMIDFTEQQYQIQLQVAKAKLAGEEQLEDEPDTEFISNRK